MNGDLKFIADASLAGMAKWLRLLGFDTVVYYQQAGRLMMNRAQVQKRVLLTRRRDMASRQFSGQMILLPEADVADQLLFVIRKLSLRVKADSMYTLCLECNEPLTALEREAVRDRVPEYVFEHCIRYNQCPKCRRIYWPGTHQQNALQFLKAHGIAFSDLS